jgi:hypothetical protein
MGGCDAEAICPVRGRWDPVNAAIRQALSGITVSALAKPRFAWDLPLPPASPPAANDAPRHAVTAHLVAE